MKLNKIKVKCSQYDQKVYDISEHILNLLHENF